MQRLLRRGARALTSPELLGAVLAGGESRRYGRDKSAEIVGGVSLLERAATTLAAVLAQVVVVAPAARTAGGWTRIEDLRPGLGPLGGIEAALDHAARKGLEGAFVLACDLPLVDASTVRRIVAALPPGGGATAASRPGARPVQPLCAAWRVGCLPAVRGALDRGELAVYRTFAEVGGVTVSVAEERLLNVNRPEDARRAEEWLGHPGP